MHASAQSVWAESNWMALPLRSQALDSEDTSVPCIIKRWKDYGAFLRVDVVKHSAKSSIAQAERLATSPYR